MVRVNFEVFVSGRWVGFEEFREKAERLCVKTIKKAPSFTGVKEGAFKKYRKLISLLEYRD
jgi:hypothetical protein